MATGGGSARAEGAARLGVAGGRGAGGALQNAAWAFARRIADHRPLPRIRDRSEKLAEGTPALFEATRKAIARRARNQRAPYACIEAVEAATTLPFDEGCALERKLFNEQVNSEAAKALRYAFFAEREVAKLPHIPAGTQLRPTDNPAVTGAGTLARGHPMDM